MTAWGLAWRTIARSPARSVLAVTGVTVIGALLFNMLLLSRGLLVSFRDLLDTAGFDVRVVAAEGSMVHRPPIADASSLADAIARLPGRAASRARPHRQRRGDRSRSARPGRAASSLARHDGQRRRRRLDARQRSAAAVDRLARRAAAHRQHQSWRPRLGLAPGSTLQIRPFVAGAASALPPVDGARRRHRRVRLRSAGRIHGRDDDGGICGGAWHGRPTASAEMVLVASRPAPDRGDRGRDREAAARPARATRTIRSSSSSTRTRSATSARSPPCCRR